MRIKKESEKKRGWNDRVRKVSREGGRNGDDDDRAGQRKEERK